ncbi:hypothetical protein B0T26DRAFT_701414, partial [Lasiosphaeria miniovina]
MLWPPSSGKRGTVETDRRETTRIDQSRTPGNAGEKTAARKRHSEAVQPREPRRDW